MARRGTRIATGFGGALGSAYAATTMWHRLSWFGAAAVMTEAERQAECTRMLSEKLAAAYEGGLKAGMETTRMISGIAFGRSPTATTQAAIVDASLRPAFRKARANARRLKRRAQKRK
jgi:hypothetical protein